MQKACRLHVDRMKGNRLHKIQYRRPGRRNDGRTTRKPKFFFHQLMHKCIVLKSIIKFTLTFTLKQLQHVSV